MHYSVKLMVFGAQFYICRAPFTAKQIIDDIDASVSVKEKFLMRIRFPSYLSFQELCDFKMCPIRRPLFCQINRFCLVFVVPSKNMVAERVVVLQFPHFALYYSILIQYHPIDNIFSSKYLIHRSEYDNLLLCLSTIKFILNIAWN